MLSVMNTITTTLRKSPKESVYGAYLSIYLYLYLCV